jgi:predicted kinase
VTTRLGQEGYTRSVTEQVYRVLAERAADALRAGHSVIVDAVFDRPWQRTAIADAALGADIPFGGLWLQAPVDVMSARIRTRSCDASDATVEVLQEQIARDVGALEWDRLDASGSPDHVLGLALTCTCEQPA